MKIPSIDLAELHPAGVIDSMQIDPPIVTWPVRKANFGFITRMNGGSKGKFSGKVISKSRVGLDP